MLHTGYTCLCADVCPAATIGSTYRSKLWRTCSQLSLRQMQAWHPCYRPRSLYRSSMPQYAVGSVYRSTPWSARGQFNVRQMEVYDQRSWLVYCVVDNTTELSVIIHGYSPSSSLNPLIHAAQIRHTLSARFTSSMFCQQPTLPTFLRVALARDCSLIL